MNFLISILVAARSLTFFTNFIGAPDTPARFLDPVLTIKGQEVMVSCLLENAYSDELRKIAATGTAVPLYIYINLKDSRTSGLVQQKVVETSLQYDIIQALYRVTRSMTRDTLVFPALDSAAKAACTVMECPAFSVAGLSKGGEYFIEIYAVLGRVNVAALKDNEVDLMYYWDFKRPLIRTEAISGAQFIR
jgi:hypothetical protein